MDSSSTAVVDLPPVSTDAAASGATTARASAFATPASPAVSRPSMSPRSLHLPGASVTPRAGASRAAVTAAVTAAGGGTAAINAPVSSPNKSTGAGMFSFSVGPAHSRIDDFEQWYQQLRFDPKKPTAAQRVALQRRDAEAVAAARSRMTTGDTQRQLLQLSSALRADLEVFVNHLLDCGSGANPASTSLVTGPADDLTPAQAAAMEAQALNKEAFLQLKSLFDILDVDRSGTLTYDELQRASVILGREQYDKAAFRKLDKDRSGSIDFLEMLKVFFPRLTMRYITKCHREYIRYADNIKTARDRLAPEHVAQMDSQFARLDRLPGGCTVENMLSFMSLYMQRNRHIVEEVFATFDADGDGRLGLEEFCEMTKFSYPPYARQPFDSTAADNSNVSVVTGDSPRERSGSNGHISTGRARRGSITGSGPRPAASSGNGNGNGGADGPSGGGGGTFSLETLARRRLIDPKSIRLPDLPTQILERPHVMHPAISGESAVRREANRGRLETIMGKAALEQHEAQAAARTERRRKLAKPPGAAAPHPPGRKPASPLPPGAEGRRSRRAGSPARSPRARSSARRM